MSNEFFNEEFEDLREWSLLINHPHFNKLRNKINVEMNSLQREIDKLVTTPNLDNSIHVIALGKAKEKLSSLLRYFDWIAEKKLRLDEEVAKRKIVYPQI